MPIKRDIPGQLREQEMQAIEILASFIPPGGAVVEVGSLLGLSSWIWATSVDQTVTVFCIDPWEKSGGSNFIKLANQNQQHFTKEQFLKNTTECQNIVALQGYSPRDFLDWAKPINLYFEDAVHTDPIFSENLNFWAGKLVTDGILCGHDYHPNFPDVQKGANRHALSMGRTLKVIGSLWYLLPDSIERSDDPAVVEKLERLNCLAEFSRCLPTPLESEDLKTYSSRVVRNIKAFDHSIVLKNAPSRIKQGENIVIEGMVRNETNEDWPIILFDTAVLKVGAELKSSVGQKYAATRSFISKPMLRAGEAAEFKVELSSAKASIGKLHVHIDLVYEHVTWFAPKGSAAVDISVEMYPAYEFSSDYHASVEDKAFWLRNVNSFNKNTRIGLDVVEEQNYLIHSSNGKIVAKSMLTSYELALLFSIARDYYLGEGKIVDLGPLIGVGTNVMARGVTQNARAKRKEQSIFSYDLFLMKGMDHFLPEDNDLGTGSVFQKFLETNKDFLDVICAVPGDFMRMKWIGEDIEVLFIDLAKTWDLNQHVVREFFPRLIPGHSIVIQQDYVHVGEPWIALQMEVFREYFDLLYFVYGATAVYRLKKPLPDTLLKIDLRSLDQKEIDQHFANAKMNAPPAVAEVLKCCEAAIKIERGDLEGAHLLLERVDPAAQDLSDVATNFIPAILPNLTAARRWLERERRALGSASRG